jgi:hypothetical protein
MKTCSHLLFLLFTCLLPGVYAQTPQKSGSISDIGFIEGRWKTTADDKAIDAVWSAPAGESIVGYVRVMKEGMVTLYELFAFEQSDRGLVALVKHFKPGLIGVEEKDSSNRYHFIQAANGRATFEKEGEAMRVQYEKRGADKFAIVIGKEVNGKWEYKDFWQFSRVK